MRRNGLFITMVAAVASGVPAIPAFAKPIKTDAIVWTGARCSSGDNAPQAGFVAALLGLVLEPLIEAGIKGVGDALKKAGAPSDIHVTGSKTTYMYAMNSGKVGPTRPVSPTADLNDRCILVAFGPAADGRTTDGRSVEIPLAPPLDANGVLDKNLMPLFQSVFDTTKMTVLVANIEPSKDGSAFQLVPRYVDLGSAMRQGSATAKRTIAITFSLFPPGATADGTATAVRTIMFEDVTASKVIGRAASRSFATDWIPLPAVSDPAKARATAAGKRADDLAALELSRKPTLKPDQLKKVDADIARLKPLVDADRLFLVTPVTWRADLHETGGGSKLLVALGGFLTGKAADIAKPIADSIDLTKAEARAGADDQLRIDAITAIDEYSKAVVAGDAAATRVALIKAQGACRRLEAGGFAEVSCTLLPTP